MNDTVPSSVTSTEPAETPWLGTVSGCVATVPTAAALPVRAPALHLVGSPTLQTFDPIAARRLEAPPYVARLRPAQMAIPVLCLAGTLVLLLFR